MGTRNLTCVVADGEYKIAQYGQWDGYPGGQGKTVLAFCRRWLRTPEGRALFREQLRVNARLMSDAEVQVEVLRLGGDEQFFEAHPYFSRDHGAAILAAVRQGVVWTRSEVGFAASSLYCEWAYVVDLDDCGHVECRACPRFAADCRAREAPRGSLEAYVGGNKTPLGPADRFSFLPVDEDDARSSYYGVRLASRWHLDKLPTQRAFVRALQDDGDLSPARQVGL